VRTWAETEQESTTEAWLFAEVGASIWFDVLGKVATFGQLASNPTVS
jgi:hypothetical protein